MQNIDSRDAAIVDGIEADVSSHNTPIIARY